MKYSSAGGFVQTKYLVIGAGLFLAGILAAVVVLKLMAPAKPVKSPSVPVPPHASPGPNDYTPTSSALTGVGRPVNLKPYYGCSTTNSIAMGGVRNHPNNLSSFPTGPVVFGGISFQVEGMIQLGSGYPPKVAGITVGAPANRIHLLHGTAGFVEDETEIATLVLHYETEYPVELPIQYGVHVRDWWMWKKDELPLVGRGSAVVWQGENEYSRSKNCQIRVYHSIFENPKPDAAITTITYNRASSAGKSTPFMLGLTVE